MVPIPLNGWQRPQNYTASQVGFVVITSSKLHNTTAVTVRDTWLSRVDYRYFLSDKPNVWLPTIVVNGTDESESSNIRKIFYGLQLVHTEQRNLSTPHKWYYIAKCNTFANVHHLLKRLDPYDYQKPYLIGGRKGTATCFSQSNTVINVDYPAGGAGVFLSATLVELILPHLKGYLENEWPNNNMNRCKDCWDIALTCLVHKLGVQMTDAPGFWSDTPARLRSENRNKAFLQNSEPNTFHFISHKEMLDLDEFYTFQFVDRLFNDNNWDELVGFARTFVSSHYETLQIKRKECILPPVITSNHSTSTLRPA